MTDSAGSGTNGERELREALEEARAENARLKSRTRFGLVWENQPEDVEQLMAARLPVLTHNKGLEVPGGLPSDRHHLLIEGDNLHALTVMQATHAESVDVIYIDPPYNTGNDFIYNDRLVDESDRWRHSSWLSFMSKRLRLAHSLLKSGGQMFVSIDDNEMAHLKLLLDQIFGEGSVKVIVVKMSEAAGVKMAAVARSGSLPKLKEYILVARKEGKVRLSVPLVPKEAWDKNYRNCLTGFTQELRARISELATRGNIADDELSELETSLNAVGYATAKSVAQSEGVNTKNPKEMTAWLFANAWRIAQDTNGGGSIRSLVDSRRSGPGLPDQAVIPVRTPRGLLYLALTKNSRTVLLADDNLMIHPGDLWTDIKTTSLSSEGGVTFRNGKKPLALMHRILASSCDSESVVLDFFAGSGTTAQAVAELNAADGGQRQAILVTNNENDICRSITHPRIRGFLAGVYPDGKVRDPLPGSLSFYETDFLPNRRNRDQAFLDFAARSSDIIAVKEGAHAREVTEEALTVLRGNGRTVAIVTDSFDDHTGFAAAAGRIAKKGDVRRAYVFTWSDDGVEAEIVEQWKGWELRPLPAPLLSAIRRRMNEDSGGLK
jgi:adenine-specific DNA-methyltransferase